MNDLLQRLRERITHATAMKRTYTAQVLQEALDSLLEYHKIEQVQRQFLSDNEKTT